MINRKTIYGVLLIGVLILASTLDADASGRRKNRGRLDSLLDESIITNEYLDTVTIKKKTVINDYSMIGIHYGATFSMCSFNPKRDQTLLFNPINIGITYTKYGKMFGYMPYFGIQVGLLYAQEGYKFKTNPETGYTPDIEGATWARMDVIELPIMAHCHIDFWKMKLLINLGLYGGYRLGIHRYGENVNPDYVRSFTPTDIRFDYGLKGGIGIGFIFDPIEIHIQAMYKYSFASLYKPDYASQYYYRFAYPNNIIVQAGIHFQLGKRIGKTRREIKREAMEIIRKENNITVD